MSTSDTRSKLFLRHVGTWSNTETYLRYDTVTHMIDDVNYVFYAITDITDMTEPSLDATEPWHVMLMGRENLVNGSLIYRDFHGAQIPVQPTEDTILAVENGIPSFVERTQFVDETMPILTGASVLYRANTSQLYWNGYQLEFANDVVIDTAQRILPVPDDVDGFDRLFCDPYVVWLIDSNNPTNVYHLGGNNNPDQFIGRNGSLVLRGDFGTLGTTGQGLSTRSSTTNRYEGELNGARLGLPTRIDFFNTNNIAILKVVANHIDTNIFSSDRETRTRLNLPLFGVAYYIEETTVDDMGVISGGRVYASANDVLNNRNLRAGISDRGVIQQITGLGTGIRDGQRTRQGVWFRSEREIFGFGRTLDVTGVGDTNTATVTRLFSFPEDITWVYIQDVNTVAMGGYVVFGAGQAAHIGVSIDGDLTRNLSSQPSPVITNPTYVDGGGATVSRSFAKIESFFMRSSVALMADGTIYIAGYFRDRSGMQRQYTTFTHLELDFLVRDIFVFAVNENIFLLLTDNGTLVTLFGDIDFVTSTAPFDHVPQFPSFDFARDYTAGSYDLPVFVDAGYTGQVVGLQILRNSDIVFYTNHGYKYQSFASNDINTRFTNNTSDTIAATETERYTGTTPYDLNRANAGVNITVGSFQLPSLRNVVIMETDDE